MAYRGAPSRDGGGSMFALVLKVAGAVGAAPRLGVGVGAGAFEFFFLVQQHLEAEGGHHQCEDAHGYDEYYEYCFAFHFCAVWVKK